MNLKLKRVPVRSGLVSIGPVVAGLAAIGSSIPHDLWKGPAPKNQTDCPVASVGPSGPGSSGLSENHPSPPRKVYGSLYDLASQSKIKMVSPSMKDHHGQT